MTTLGNGYGDSFLYRATDIQVIQNTTDEISQFSPNSLGKKTIAPNLLKEGDVIRYDTRVLISTGVSQDATQRIKFGSVTLITNTGTLPNSLSDNYAELELDIKILAIGVTGSVCVMGRTLIQSGVGIVTASMRALFTVANVTIDTTIENDLELTYQWANAIPENILKVRNANISLFN